MKQKTTKAPKLTPMMQQYMDVKRNLPKGALLLFRLGDFYEMFEDDAVRGSKLLGITLTHRNGQQMAGIPYHAAQTYIQKVLVQGVKVAICDQMETPQPGKIVKRQLTRILTPGTILEDHQIQANSSNYLMALNVVPAPKKSAHSVLLSIAWMDLSTGEFHIACDACFDSLLSLISSLDPKELILPEMASGKWAQDETLQHWHKSFEQFCAGRAISELPDYRFDLSDGIRSVKETLGVLNLDGFGIQETHPSLGVAGALIHYATENLCSKPENLTRIKEYSTRQTLLLDPATQRHLEIFRSSGGTRVGSLLQAMDGTVTPPGARLLEQYLATPPLCLQELQRRQQCVGEFLESPAYAAEMQEYLKCIRDLPRILGRLRNRLRNPRELGGIRDTLQQIPLILEVLFQFDGPAVAQYNSRIKDFPALRTLLERALADELPTQLQDGGYIRDGYDEELDRLRNLNRNSKNWIAELEQAEQERTGIKKLRIKFNNAFGYFIEITKSNLHLVPDDYIRRQTTVNAERYYTPDLKEKEKEILSASEKAVAREEILFRDLVAAVLEETDALEDTATGLAEIDLFLGWAKLARRWDYCCPQLDDSSILRIDAGRHPVVEQILDEQKSSSYCGNDQFIPNDVSLSASDDQIAIITGPNMAGKSTYIRQVALITLMAQVGSWVPASGCRVGLVDRIFSRVGASDDLARGNSTFMVEMNETANILNNATAKSLIILDEIGRGTSTYDGLSIAWAVVEHLHGAIEEGKLDETHAFAGKGPRTLFATHYHELTQIEKQLPRIRNFSVAVKEWNDEIIFVRQVLPGAADRSYGIQVARLAGLPLSVISRAKTILAKLEEDDSSHNLLRKRFRQMKNAEEQGEAPQLELF
ncbi:MAG: DNA mismatch repair protein MutS [Opitutales bacterium]|nr:DNA mismatch repair protein MutS [Opitutales bacterium]